MFNGPVHVLAKTIKSVMASAMEAEMKALAKTIGGKRTGATLENALSTKEENEMKALASALGGKRTGVGALCSIIPG